MSEERETSNIKEEGKKVSQEKGERNCHKRKGKLSVTREREKKCPKRMGKSVTQEKGKRVITREEKKES